MRFDDVGKGDAMSDKPYTEVPCPFCGCGVWRTVVLHDATPTTAPFGYRVECDADKCLARGPLRDTEDEAVAAWRERKT